jgi:hypothetical protein
MAEGVIADGTRIVFESSGFVGFIVGIDFDIPGRTALDTTHLASTLPVGSNQFGGRTYIPTTLADPGSMTMTLNFDPEIELPPLNNAPEFIRIEFPTPPGLTTPASFRGQAFITSSPITIRVQELIQGTITMKAIGIWERTPAA